MLSVETKIWIVKRAVEGRKFRNEPFSDLEEKLFKLNEERRSNRKK